MKNNQPIIIGITGGIGSGKTTAAKYFEQLGFPVYNSDLRAKIIQNENPKVINAIKALFGEEAYNEDGMNRPFIASKIFNNQEKLQRLNAIVHPAVFQDFEDWKNQQNSKFLMKEAAILIESGSYKDCDIIISVVANKEIRISRTMERDGLTRDEVEARMQNQLSDEDRIQYSDFTIDNSQDIDYLYNQIKIIVDKIKNNINFE